jgi:intracellular septation protein
MQLFYEFFPVLLFFVAFKLYGIYVATVVGIVTTFLQVVITRVWTTKWDRKQLITLAVFLVFGGMTLYFHDPIFVKWKPTIIFWIFALVILGSHIFTHKPLMQRLMENAVQQGNASVPVFVWKIVNVSWACFFLLLGGVNLYIAYHLSNDAWVNFKFYGITSALFVFSLLQAFYLTRYVTSEKE